MLPEKYGRLARYAVIDVGLFVLGGYYLWLCPFTKVEESFNVQAVYDLQFSQWDFPDYDHLRFPGVVPRSFLGPMLLSFLTSMMNSIIYPFIALFWDFQGNSAEVISESALEVQKQSMEQWNHLFVTRAVLMTVCISLCLHLRNCLLHSWITYEFVRYSARRLHDQRRSMGDRIISVQSSINHASHSSKKSMRNRDSNDHFSLNELRSSSKRRKRGSNKGGNNHNHHSNHHHHSHGNKGGSSLLSQKGSHSKSSDKTTNHQNGGNDHGTDEDCYELYNYDCSLTVEPLAACPLTSCVGKVIHRQLSLMSKEDLSRFVESMLIFQWPDFWIARKIANVKKTKSHSMSVMGLSLRQVECELINDNKNEKDGDNNHEKSPIITKKEEEKKDDQMNNVEDEEQPLPSMKNREHNFSDNVDSFSESWGWIHWQMSVIFNLCVASQFHFLYNCSRLFANVFAMAVCSFAVKYLVLFTLEHALHLFDVQPRRKLVTPPTKAMNTSSGVGSTDSTTTTMMMSSKPTLVRTPEEIAVAPFLSFDGKNEMNLAVKCIGWLAVSTIVFRCDTMVLAVPVMVMIFTKLITLELSLMKNEENDPSMNHSSSSFSEKSGTTPSSSSSLSSSNKSSVKERSRSKSNKKRRDKSSHHSSSSKNSNNHYHDRNIGDESSSLKKNSTNKKQNNTENNDDTSISVSSSKKKNTNKNDNDSYLFGKQFYLISMKLWFVCMGIITRFCLPSMLLTVFFDGFLWDYVPHKVSMLDPELMNRSISLFDFSLFSQPWHIKHFVLWPEIQVFYFNTVLGGSLAYGTSPMHWYFTSGLMKLLLLSYPLSFLSIIYNWASLMIHVMNVLVKPRMAVMDSMPNNLTLYSWFRSRYWIHRNDLLDYAHLIYDGICSKKDGSANMFAVDLFGVTYSMIFLYSMLPHKEVRFLYLALPLLHCLSFLGLYQFLLFSLPSISIFLSGESAPSSSSSSSLLKKRMIHASLMTVTLLTMVYGVCYSAAYVSAVNAHNYPGGMAMLRLSQLIQPPKVNHRFSYHHSNNDDHSSMTDRLLDLFTAYLESDLADKDAHFDELYTSMFRDHSNNNNNNSKMMNSKNSRVVWSDLYCVHLSNLATMTGALRHSYFNGFSKAVRNGYLFFDKSEHLSYDEYHRYPFPCSKTIDDGTLQSRQLDYYYYNSQIRGFQTQLAVSCLWKGGFNCWHFMKPKKHTDPKDESTEFSMEPWMNKHEMNPNNTMNYIDYILSHNKKKPGNRTIAATVFEYQTRKGFDFLISEKKSVKDYRMVKNGTVPGIHSFSLFGGGWLGLFPKVTLEPKLYILQRRNSFPKLY